MLKDLSTLSETHEMPSQCELLMNYGRIYYYLILVKAMRDATLVLCQRSSKHRRRENSKRTKHYHARSATILFLMRPADTLTKQWRTITAIVTIAV